MPVSGNQTWSSQENLFNKPSKDSLYLGIVPLVVKNPLASAEDTRAASLMPRSEYPLEEEMAPWKITWVEKPGGYSP